MIIEGQEICQDLSYQWVIGYEDLRTIEAAFPIWNFTQEFERRDTEMEFRVYSSKRQLFYNKILRRLTETQYHNENLVDFHPDTQKLNRYNNILPFKHSLVVLKNDIEDENMKEENLRESYINANFINTVNGSKQIIATQGPLNQTTRHFWRMIWQEKVDLIVMLCNLRENGRVQCDQYWPKELGETNHLGQVCLKLESQDESDSTVVFRKLKLNDRLVTQIQWTGWADQSVPSSQDFDVLYSIVNLVVEQIQQGVRVVFHCSAGVGRTGTLIALCNIIMTIQAYLKQINNETLQIEKNPDLYKITVFGTVRRLREQRWGMVHTAEQYTFIYKFIDKAIKKLLKKE